jgi:hypothetical protein
MLLKLRYNRPPLQVRFPVEVCIVAGRQLAFLHSGHYLAGVSRRTHPKKPTSLRSWRVSLIRKNEKAAEAAAVAEFHISDEQRGRLVVSERD